MESGKQNQQVGEIDPSPPRRMTLNKKNEVSLLADGSTHKTLSVSAHISTTDDDINSAEFDGESSFSNVHVPAEDDKDSLPSWMVERMEPKRWN